MTGAAAVLARCRAVGVELEPRGDRLHWRYPGGLPADLAAELVRHKSEVMAALGAGRIITLDQLLEPDVRVCWACKRAEYWTHPATGRRICATCHPPRGLS